MAETDPLDPSILVARLHGLRHTLSQLVAELHIIAQRAEMFAGRRRPGLSGTPQLKAHRDALARWYEQAVGELDRRRGPVAEELLDLLTAADVPPPIPVPGATYAFQAVVRVARAVRNIGWGDGTKQLRGARDPWHKRTPAQRLSRAELWVWEGVSLPHFGDPAVYAEFNAALAREFDRAGRLAGGVLRRSGGGGKVTEDIHRRAWSGAAPASVTRPAVVDDSGKNRHAVSESVRAVVLSVFRAREVLTLADVLPRVRAAMSGWLTAGHIRRSLAALASSGDARLKRVRQGRYTLA